jgi:hypothetical protein
VTLGTIQEISFRLHRYLGKAQDRSTFEAKIRSLVSELSKIAEFWPDSPKADFDQTVTGAHGLAVYRLLGRDKIQH